MVSIISSCWRNCFPCSERKTRCPQQPWLRWPVERASETLPNSGAREAVKTSQWRKRKAGNTQDGPRFGAYPAVSRGIVAWFCAWGGRGIPRGIPRYRALFCLETYIQKPPKPVSCGIVHGSGPKTYKDKAGYREIPRLYRLSSPGLSRYRAVSRGIPWHAKPYEAKP